MSKDKDLEERLLKKQELEERIQKDSFELAELRQKDALIVKPKQIEKDFNKLKVVTDGRNIVSTQVYSRQAVYDYFNESEGTITPISGLQAQTVFGANDELWTRFGKKELGPVHRVADKFTLKFRHFEIN